MCYHWWVSEGIENLTLELLRAIRSDMSGMRTEQRGWLGATERSLAHLERDSTERWAEAGGRFDRILDRLDRIERRLELSIHPA